ncbi:MAG: hypothetical protein Q7U47_01415 [Paludibacter sp.]|nr:hypothetical protein [Paludibacter sp.]
MSTTIPRPGKPSTGVLMYGNKQVGQPDTFRNLTWRQIELIRQGYDKKLFHKHYYYGK